MARAQQAAQKTEEKEQPAVDAPERDSPLLDLSDQAVKRLLKSAKAKGYVTLDQLNSVLPSEEVSSDQIEDLYATLSDMGITVVENEDGEEAAEGSEESGDEEEGRALVAQNNALVKSEAKSEPAERTDDPVRMYLREMGSVELLSREGEIAIAKRIEAGREAMIAGLCESPLTFQAIIIWRDELNEGKIVLRDIIDLEATYEGPEAKEVQEAASEDSPEPEQPAANQRPSGAPEGEGDDDDEFENAMS
ncbi:MAG: RNA polymerase sigma factor RpoD, partial [Hyphomicrobium denitrificans]|nr:RNA polymerase sigma factor RpoD [Hyphomicrobium denitrificans]